MIILISHMHADGSHINLSILIKNPDDFIVPHLTLVSKPKRHCFSLVNVLYHHTQADYQHVYW